MNIYICIYIYIYIYIYISLNISKNFGTIFDHGLDPIKAHS